MTSLKQVTQILMMNLLRDMYVNQTTEVISVWAGLFSKSSRLVLKIWHDHDQNKWRVWSPYGDNAEFYLLSDALDKARTVSYELRASELV